MKPNPTKPSPRGKEIKADEARYYEPKTTKLPVGMKIKCMCCGGGGIGNYGLIGGGGGGGGGSLHCPHCPLSHSFIPSAGKAGWEEVNKLTMDEAQRQKIPHHLQEHTIDFWKVELSGLIYDMVNHRPNKRIGYIPNYKDITVFISSELARERERLAREIEGLKVDEKRFKTKKRQAWDIGFNEALTRAAKKVAK